MSRNIPAMLMRSVYFVFLEAVRILGLTQKTKIYQASTSELFGKVEEVPQRETTPFHPYSPYAVAKQYGFWIVKSIVKHITCLQ